MKKSTNKIVIRYYKNGLLRITIGDEVYYFKNDTLYLSNLCEEAELAISQKIKDWLCKSISVNGLLNTNRLSLHLKQIQSSYPEINFKNMGENDFFEYVKQRKDDCAYRECIILMFYGMSKFFHSPDYYIKACPMITSCYRKLNQPQEAINFWNWMNDKPFYEAGLSKALFTSLAAAYIDIDDYKTAERFAKWAYKESNGNPDIELQIVYSLINDYKNNPSAH